MRRLGSCLAVAAVLAGPGIADCRGAAALVPAGRRLATVDGGGTTVGAFERVVATRMDEAGVAGLSAAIINDGRVVYARTFGFRNADDKAIPDDTTEYAAASLSKPVFAYLVLTLARRQILDLDRPLAAYVTRAALDSAGYADLTADPRWVRITARMVVSHSSGLANVGSENGGQALAFDPGAGFRYSGRGYELLQTVVERVTHQDLETLARENVFAPLGMRHTSYVWQARFESDAAWLHNEYGWASEPNRPPTPDAAGSLTTTAHDYARFMAHLLAASRVARGGVGAMFAPQLRITSAHMFEPADSGRGEAGPRPRLAWGLGWGLLDTPAGPAFFHTGHSEGAQNYVIAYRRQRIGIVLLSNSDAFESVARPIVAAAIGDSASPFDWLGYTPFDPATRKTPPPRLIAIHVAPEVLARYVGSYTFDSLDVTTRIRLEGDHLAASDDGQSWDPLSAAADSVFFFRGRALTLTFRRDASGRVTRCEVVNGNARMTAHRVP